MNSIHVHNTTSRCIGVSRDAPAERGTTATRRFEVAPARRPPSIRYTALMGILIGMDEAGYGPHLGPLVIAATAWQVPDELSNGEVASATVKPRRTKSKVHASTTEDSDI